MRYKARPIQPGARCRATASHVISPQQGDPNGEAANMPIP